MELHSVEKRKKAEIIYLQENSFQELFSISSAFVWVNSSRSHWMNEWIVFVERFTSFSVHQSQFHFRQEMNFWREIPQEKPTEITIRFILFDSL